MSVLIHDMEMPGRCGHCPCFNAENPIHCQAVKADKAKRIAAPYGLPRPDWCPLVEVPPHGRLVDESWLKKAMITTLEALKKNPKMDRQEMHLIAAFDTLRAMVEDAPTIIEAEE